MGSSPTGVHLVVQDQQVVIDNGIFQLTLSKPGGTVTCLQYNGLDNLMEILNTEDDRGYYDMVWNKPGGKAIYNRIQGTDFKVILQNDNQVEVSFARTWDPSQMATAAPLNIDKRYVVLRGCSGFYSYAIYEHVKEWPDFNMGETRIVFKLRKDKFHYMAVADNRQRIMPMPDDRMPGRAQQLAYPEAVKLINPLNPNMIGEVDDKYQYSCDNKDSRVHGWISKSPSIGFWQITPSDEFRTAGPVKQDLTSHVGPITLAMFISAHYAGDAHVPKFKYGEYWKKVFGPVFFYLNSATDTVNQKTLWTDAKLQMKAEVQHWPYRFPVSDDFPKAEQRGSVSGRLLVRDRYVYDQDTPASSAYVGLALPGEPGSWQRECKGYQFWVRTDSSGRFFINHVRPGQYNLFGWVPRFVGDYKYDVIININPGSSVVLHDLVFEPPRNGPTLWEVGIPDRSAAEFYVPDPDPNYINKLYINHPDRFRQYGLWERYEQLYPNSDLVYTVGVSNYKKDWFFAHVTRKGNQNTYEGTTWQIRFKLDNINETGVYTFRIAIASAALAELQVCFNNATTNPPHFSTGLIGRDNTIARHGIHGLYWLFNIDVHPKWLVLGNNTIFLTQTRCQSPFQGIMYDYLRFEAPSIKTELAEPKIDQYEGQFPHDTILNGNNGHEEEVGGEVVLAKLLQETNNQIENVESMSNKIDRAKVQAEPVQEEIDQIDRAERNIDRIDQDVTQHEQSICKYNLEKPDIESNQEDSDQF